MSTTSGRIYGLDILRAYAIMAVVAFHGQGLLLKNNIIRRIIDYVCADGVTIFFVLSGFLIGGILIQTVERSEFNSKELLNFWKRRWFRTLPAYFLILIVLSLLEFSSETNFNYELCLRYFTFTQNLFTTPSLTYFGESWSLSVEEWFYLILPSLLFISFKFTSIDKNKIILFWIFAVIIFENIFRIYIGEALNCKTYDEWVDSVRRIAFVRLDSLMYGVLGAYLQHYHYSKCTIKYSTKILLFITGCFMITWIYYINIPWPIWISLISIGTLMLFPLLLTIKTGKGIIYKTITFISIISYSLYLVHQSLVLGKIMPTLNEKMGLIAPVYYILYYALSIVLAFFLYNYYEHPMTNLRDLAVRKNNLQTKKYL